MDFEFYFDPVIHQTHIEKHEVTVLEIYDFFLASRYLEQMRKDDSYIAIGKLKTGRILEVVYRKKTNNLYYIITAYDLIDHEKVDFLQRYLDV